MKQGFYSFFNIGTIFLLTIFTKLSGDNSKKIIPRYGG